VAVFASHKIRELLTRMTASPVKRSQIPDCKYRNPKYLCLIFPGLIIQILVSRSFSTTHLIEALSYKIETTPRLQGVK